MTPVDETRQLVSLNECGVEPSANSFLPPPRTTGTVKMLIASTRSLASSACTSSVLPCVDEVRAVLLLQTLHVGDVAEEHRALPAGIDLARARNRVLLDLVEQFRDAAVRRIFVVVRPAPGENLVGLAAEGQIEPLLGHSGRLFGT